MTGKHLHIVSFDVPLPADYGGVIDVFYKIKSLQQAGWEITLHCFSYGREEDETLGKYCKDVHYYTRKTGLTKILSPLPYIVATRDDETLLTNLLKDESPILFEGLHTTFHLRNPALSQRCTIVRTHNIEHVYYRALASKEKHPLKRFYYLSEAAKLEKYESVLNRSSLIAAIAQHEQKYFDRVYGSKSFLLPPFHEGDSISSLPGIGKFALYHGNLSINENKQSALFLIEQVFSRINYPLIIAGHQPGNLLKQKVRNYPSIILEENPTAERMSLLQQQAHVHVLPTFQSTGIKLKLISALFNGRHVLVNDKMLEGTMLKSACVTANTAEEWKTQILRLAEVAFTEDFIEKRRAILSTAYSNGDNAANLTEKILTYIR